MEDGRWKMEDGKMMSVMRMEGKKSKKILWIVLIQINDEFI